jgi:nucleoside-diphosphate-sugar epimerase
MTGNKNLLIIGGTGFIGKNVVREAVHRGFKVSVISKNNCPAVNKLKGVGYIVVDIVNKVKLLEALEGKSFHYVINLGGYVNHIDYSDGGNKVFKMHFDGIKNLVSCIDKKFLKSFVQIGSSDEYGNNVAPQNESQREMPISPYSLGKVTSTHFLQMLHRTEGLSVVILRPFLVYGPGQDNNRFIPQIIRGCVNDEEFSVSTGGQLRDFCYIDDIVDVILLALINDKAYGEVINIASGVPISIKDMILTIKSLVGFGKPQFGLVPYRNGENMALYADVSKANNLLGWSPKIDLAVGLDRTIKYEK